MGIRNEVLITEEARLDYLDVVGVDLPEEDIKTECELYLENLIASGKLGYSGYLHVNYIDLTTEVRVKLFFYQVKASKDGRAWELQGVCLPRDYDEIWEEKGRVRTWLKSKLYDDETSDWVWDMRIREKQEQRSSENIEDKGYAKMIKELLKGYKLNKKKVKLGTADQKTIDEVTLLDECIAELDEESRQIIVELYLEGYSLAKVGQRHGFVKGAISYKRDRAINILELLFERKDIKV